LPGLITIL